jgi:hypothetical protein
MTAFKNLNTNKSWDVTMKTGHSTWSTYMAVEAPGPWDAVAIVEQYMREEGVTGTFCKIV